MVSTFPQSDTGFIEAGTKTTVTVSASAYDERPGESGDDVGCGEDGCLPDLAHDGIGEEDVESRWSCAKDIVSDGGQCEIEFTFGSPQHIMDVEVAFWKGEERARTLKVRLRVLMNRPLTLLVTMSFHEGAWWGLLSAKRGLVCRLCRLYW